MEIFIFYLMHTILILALLLILLLLLTTIGVFVNYAWTIVVKSNEQ